MADSSDKGSVDSESSVSHSDNESYDSDNEDAESTQAGDDTATTEQTATETNDQSTTVASSPEKSELKSTTESEAPSRSKPQKEVNVKPQKPSRSFHTELPKQGRAATTTPTGHPKKKKKTPLVSTQFEDVRKKLHPNLPLPHKVTRTLHEMTMNTPSPGPKYLPKDSFVKPSAPAVGLSSQTNRFGSNMERKRFLQSDSPGPVYYVECKWRSKPVSFGQGCRFRTVHDLHPSPGPADYEPDVSKWSRYQSKKGFAWSTTDRPMNAITPEQFEELENEKRREVHRMSHTKEKPKKKQGTRIIGGPLKLGAPSTFGTAHQTFLKPSEGPGPAAYQPFSTSGKDPETKGKMYNKGPTLRTSGRDIPVMGIFQDDIGPGHFSPNYDSIHAKAPAAMCYLTSS